MNILNSDIFKSRHIFRTILKIQHGVFQQKQVNYNHIFSKCSRSQIFDRVLKMPLNKYSLTCRTLSIIENSDIFRYIHVLFRHIQPYCGIFRTLLYSDSWHIQSPRYIQNSVQEYPCIFRTLCNDPILKTLPYSEL